MSVLGIMITTKFVMILTVTPSAWFISLGVRFVMLGMLAKILKSLSYSAITADKTNGGQRQGRIISSLFPLTSA